MSKIFEAYAQTIAPAAKQIDEAKTVKIDKMKPDGTIMKGKIAVGVGDMVDFKKGTKPVKGKNKAGIHAGDIDQIKGDLIHIEAGEEGAFWYKSSDVYWSV